MVFGSHVEIARLGRMMRRLFRDVVASGMIRKFPIAGECLSQDGVEWFLNATARLSECRVKNCDSKRGLRRLDVPTTEVELYRRYKSLNWIVDVGHWEQSLWMCHETIACQNIAMSSNRVPRDSVFLKRTS
jgi:hypothetical protein